MMNKSRRMLAVSQAFAMVALMACGGGEGTNPSESTPAPTPTPASSPAPAPATGSATGTAHLSWDVPSDTPAHNYRIYYGGAPGTYDQPLGSGVAADTATSHTVAGLDVGKTYYFAVTAVDAEGNESGYSNEASKLVE